jgi:autotransporter-associated beta strand protein
MRTTNVSTDFINKNLCKFFIVALFSLTGISTKAQTTYDWLDSAPDGNWKQGTGGAARWNPGGLWDEPFSSSATRLRFNNNHFTTMTNNVAGGYVIGQLFLGSSATNSRTIGGNSINFFEYGGTWPRIENQSTTLHTINFPFNASTNSGFNMELVASSGNIDFGGAINNNGRTIQIYGNNSAIDAINRSIRLGGVVSGSGILNISQFGVVKLNATHTYTGQTQIDNGELWIESSGSIASGSGIFVGNGAQMANISKFWLSNATGSTTFARNITINNGNATTRYLGGLNTSGTHTFSGNITNNSTTGGLYLSALNSGGTTTFSGVISGSGAILIDGLGTVVLSNTNTYTGGTRLLSGTLSASAAANLGNASGAITIGNGSTTGTLNITGGNLSRTVLNVTDASSAGVINVAEGQTFTLTNLNTASGTNNTTKIGKSGPGTLTLSEAGTYVGQTQVGYGTVIVSNNAGLGTNNSIVARGIDLGLNVGDVSQGYNVSVLATTGITVPQSIYVAPNTSSAKRTIGLSGGSGTATFSNEIYLDGTLTTSGTGTVVLSGRLTNTGGLIADATTTTLSHTANNFTGTTSISESKALRLNPTANATYASQVVLNGGTLSTTSITATRTWTSSSTLNVSANSTIALGTANHSLYFAASDGVTWNGSTLTITGWTGNDGESGTAGKIFVGNSSSGLTSGQLAKITINSKAVTQLSTGEIVPRATIYQSKQTGNWDATSTWERSLDGGANWVAAITTPTSVDGTITILNGHSVTINSSVTIDQVIVNSGGSLLLSALISTLNDGPGVDLDISGVFEQNGGTLTQNGQITVRNGGILRQAKVGTTIPTATWISGSTCEVTGWTTTLGGGINQSFSNFTWNCAGQTSTTMALEPTSMSVGGLFKIASTGTGNLSLGNSTTSRSLTVNSFEINVGNFYVTGASATQNMTFNVTNNALQTGGTFDIGRSNTNSGTCAVGGTFTTSSGSTRIQNNSGAGGIISTLTITGNVSIQGGSIDLDPTSAGSNVGRLFVKSNLAVSSGSLLYTRGATGPVTTGSTGVYFDGTSTQTFTHSDGTLSTASGGVGRRFFYKTSSGPTINEVYNSSLSAQTTVNGTEGTSIAAGYAAWPTSGSTINNLIIDNSAGLTLSTAKVINGTLNLTNGNITPGANTLTLAATATFTGGSASSYVNGVLNRVFTATGSATFPVGKAGVYRPVGFQYTALTGTSTVSVNQIETALTGTLPADTNLNNARTWDISQSGGSAFTYNVTLDPTGDTTTGTVVMLKRESITTTSNATTSPNFTNATGFTTLTGTNNFTLGSTCTVTSDAGSNQTICTGALVTLAANTPSFGTGAWSVSGPSNSTSQLNSISDPSATFTPAGGAGTYTLTWTITNGSCTANSNVTITVSNNNTWIGDGGLWSNGANWSCGSVPLGTSNITISSGTPTLDGDFTVGNSGSLTLNGTASLIINSSASLTIQGTANLNNRPVTFKSDVNGSAAFGTLTGTLNGATNVTTERYFSAKRAFRFTSSSVTTSASIRANWQEGVNNTTTTFLNNQNPNPGFGTHITGTGGSANGFDPTISNASSLFAYNNTTSTWSAVTNTSTNTLNAGVPYRINVRGDRSIDISLTNATATATVLRTTGTLYTGTFNPGNLSTTAYAYNLVGNPYQAPVNMKSVLDNATNLINSVYYVWDPKMGSRGAYISVDLNTNTPNNITSRSNKFLQPGLACFVRTSTSGATPALNFQESYKDITSPNSLVFRNENQNTSAISTIKMRLYDSNSLALNQTALDGSIVFFDDLYNNGVDLNDGAKFTNPDEMFSTFNSGALISIEKRMQPTTADIIPIRISQYRGTNYTIVVEGENLNGIPAYLHDQFLQTYTEIPQSGSVNYPYTVVTTNTQTTATDRFSIVYNNPLLSTANNEWKNFTLYPNPSKEGDFSIILGQPLENGKIAIYNTLGVKVYSQNLENTVENNITPKQNMPTGVYYVEIQNGSEKSIKKLIIEY